MLGHSPTTFALAMRFWVSMALLIASLLIALLAGEGVVRLTGHQPWSPLPRFDGIPAVTQPDAELGWTNKPGHYLFSAVPGLPAVAVTVAADGSRSAHTGPLGGPDAVWVMGCSLTYGWGVGDGETYTAVAAAELAARGLGDKALVNLGVAGYGTLQTWLLFQRRAKDHPAPKMVLYGLFGGHGERNLGLHNFTRVLDRAASQQAWVAMPYARLDPVTGEPKFHPPERYRRWPGAGRSALINLAQERFDQISDLRLQPTRHELTLKLIRRFADDSHALGAKFVVLILHLGDDDASLRDDLKRNGIPFLDMTDMGYPSPDTIVPGDGHPNALMHARWGKRLADFLQGELSGSAQSASTTSR
jgi:lysophospholipase L1-like esterase